MENVLGIFAKEPQAGQTKTRLCPPLSPAEAAAFYAVSLEESVARMAAGAWRLVIFYSGKRDYFARAFPGVPLLAQQGAELGARMDHALRVLLDAGARAAVLIGSDSPDLPLEHVQEAFAALAGHEAVLAPALDGGYVLIGESRHHPELFADIPWSTSRVLAATRQRARAAGIDLRELAPWDDLDDWAALESLLARAPASLTARFMQSRLAHHF
ncbi:TIGR04282 family arsenosugar biosynthesis glycosyltransferase [Geoalkalibacter halelectricus]|uniref:TIGR04282 family arsenosugar biosynthesis glycosyltransferase n=1 Tax=Geoalkalibacter halelectricus TaxID=2847045 RepID=A0ABY5ZJS8_9BACT|nr:TIGR04282 family arsenosugar biosynthesis glycosyltransferase [Geoalkalibacter halelectricus]MDO3378197.1 TIGR04282 family arsenosugar biosynthesis glycosyltransferase [Geoalkalibacter halelectricus]UWZ78040.1 TIGR04282 family arsenosugar biosynthesis glycosyltransferase [Geoalkalibacter halelectricus]